STWQLIKRSVAETERMSLVTINRSTNSPQCVRRDSSIKPRPLVAECALPPTRRRRNLTLLFLLAAGVLCGCGKCISVPSTVPVTGVVKYKGKPLQGIRVTLHSQAETAKATFIPTGQTGPDGKFKLSTGAPGNGAPPGTYVVTFEKPEIKGYVETEV